MAHQHTEKASRITGCVAAADPTMMKGGCRVALTGAAQNVSLPTDKKESGKASNYAGHFIRVVARGANVQFAEGEGTAAPTIVKDQLSVMGVGHVSFGMSLIKDIPESWAVGDKTTFFAWIGEDGAVGNIEIVVTDRQIA